MAEYGGGEYAMMADAAGDGLPPVLPTHRTPASGAAADSRLSLVRRVPAVLSGALTLRRGRLGRSLPGCWAEVRSGVLLVYGSRRDAGEGTTPPVLLLPLDNEAVIRRVGGGDSGVGGGDTASVAVNAAGAPRGRAGGAGGGATPSVGRALRVSHPEAGTATLTFARVEDARHWQVVLATAAAARRLSPADFPIVAPVGRGGSGSVFAALDAATGEAVAVKVIQKYDAYHSDGSLRHAVDERLVAELATGGCPYILALRHAFQTPSALYLVSEWCGGGDLRSALRRRPGSTLTRPEAVRILSQLVVAVGFLHRLGVVHRDIKAENVFLATAPPVAPDGGPDLSAAVIRLGDMGLAKKLPAGRHGRTRSFCGTDEYMAPEVVLGHPYGTSVDWWSLGVLAARLLTGRLPYAGPPGGRPAANHRLFESIVTEDPNLPAGLDADVEELLHGLLNRDEGRRWDEMRVRDCAFFAGVDWAALEEGPDGGVGVDGGRRANGDVSPAAPASGRAPSSMGHTSGGSGARGGSGSGGRTVASSIAPASLAGAASLADDLSGLDLSRYADLTLGTDAPDAAAAGGNGGGGGGGKRGGRRGGDKGGLVDGGGGGGDGVGGGGRGGRRPRMRARVKGLFGAALGGGLPRRPSATSIMGYSFTSEWRGAGGAGGVTAGGGGQVPRMAAQGSPRRRTARTAAAGVVCDGEGSIDYLCI
ncbi:hypothetical protein MMPV_005578 [Pyropia vietnamensis]